MTCPTPRPPLGAVGRGAVRWRPSGHKPDRNPAVQRSPRKGAAPLRNKVHVEVLALRASILGAHLNDEISPASLTKECGHTVVRLGCFLGCEGEIAEVGSLSRGAFCPEDEKLASILRGVRAMFLAGLEMQRSAGLVLLALVGKVALDHIERLGHAFVEMCRYDCAGVHTDVQHYRP